MFNIHGPGQDRKTKPWDDKYFFEYGKKQPKSISERQSKKI